VDAPISFTLLRPVADLTNDIERSYEIGLMVLPLYRHVEMTIKARCLYLNSNFYRVE
jgi:hypothetical protein